MRRLVEVWRELDPAWSVREANIPGAEDRHAQYHARGNSDPDLAPPVRSPISMIGRGAANGGRPSS